MKRARRIILNGLTLLSLVLGMTTVVIWVRSYWIADDFYHVHQDADEEGFSSINVRFANMGRVWITSEHQRFGQRVRMGEAFVAATGWPVHSAGPPSDRPEWISNSRWFRWLGIGFRRWDSSGMGLVHWTLVVPLWMGLPFFMIPSISAFLWAHARHRREKKRCAFCGYDLRATPDRCPECGTAPDKVKA
jgi:hypothetical protein